MKHIRQFEWVVILVLVPGIAAPRPTWAQAKEDSEASEIPRDPPLDQWKRAVLAADVDKLKTFFSPSLSVQVLVETGKGDQPSNVADEAAFWAGLKAQSLDIEIIRTASPQPDTRLIAFQAKVGSRASSKLSELYISVAQVWKVEGEEWHLLLLERTEPAHLKQPLNKDKDIYPAGADAHAEIKEAEEKAAKEQKRVLLVFGANWCYDCHVLDLAFQRPDFLPAVARYEVVHVDIGKDGKKNGDVAKQFQVPLEKGVPALAVVESTGKLVVSQKNGEFENARAMTPQALLEFLNRWKLEAC